MPLEEGQRQEDVHLQDDMSSLKPGDTIWISRVNPELLYCDSDSYHHLENLVGEVLTVTAYGENIDLCQEDDTQYEGEGILVHHPKLEGHDGHGYSKVKNDNLPAGKE